MQLCRLSGFLPAGPAALLLSLLLATYRKNAKLIQTINKES